MAQSNDMIMLNAETAASSRDGARVRALATELFDALRTATSDGVGITRESYGKGESAALDIIDAKARALGLRTERDAGANLVATLRARNLSCPFLPAGPISIPCPKEATSTARPGSSPAWPSLPASSKTASGRAGL